MTCKVKVTNEGPEPHRIAVEAVDHTTDGRAESVPTGKATILAVGESCEITVWNTRDIRVSEA